FAAPVVSPIEFVPQFLAAGDLNKDGKLDLAAYNSDGTMSFLLNTGVGAFPTRTRYVVSPYFGDLSSFWVTNFDGDGNPDVVLGAGQPAAITPAAGSLRVTVMLGRGDGTFEGAPVYATARDAQQSAVGDFNGDGRPDIAVVGNPGNGPPLVQV